MSQIYALFEEESSHFDFLGDFLVKLEPNININLKAQYNKEIEAKGKESDRNDFEIEFKKVFNDAKNFSTIKITGKELQPLIDRKIFKQIIPKQENPIGIKYDKKYFPFSQGIGLDKCLEKLGYSVKYISPFEINLLPLSLVHKNINQAKFNIIDFSKNRKGKIKKSKKKRKYKPDDVRKKIKSKFHKSIKNVINENLQKARSKKLFDFFPQYFLSNITIKLNNKALNYTFEELIKMDIASDILGQNKTEIDKEKYYRNLDVLDYLEHNRAICEISLFNKIRNMRYIDLLNAYFSSKEFEESIIELHNKKERIEYLEEYINKSLNYVHFFSTNGSYR